MCIDFDSYSLRYDYYHQYVYLGFQSRPKKNRNLTKTPISIAVQNTFLDLKRSYNKRYEEIVHNHKSFLFGVSNSIHTGFMHNHGHLFSHIYWGFLAEMKYLKSAVTLCQINLVLVQEFQYRWYTPSQLKEQQNCHKSKLEAKKKMKSLETLNFSDLKFVSFTVVVQPLELQYLNENA